MNRKAICLTAIMIAGFVCAVVTPAIACDDGATMFKAKCAMCHGQDATGKTPMGSKLNIPDLTSAAVQKQSDAEITGVITKGRNKMPEYGSKLTKDQIAELGKYIRSVAKK
ncbi:MAG: c-type cytochrome [Terriglobales bacterium]